MVDVSHSRKLTIMLLLYHYNIFSIICKLFCFNMSSMAAFENILEFLLIIVFLSQNQTNF